MTNDEAKLILSALRPGGEDQTDPLFTDALAQARLCTELNDWLAGEQAFDRVFAARLREVTPPPHLRSAILAGARMSRKQPPRGMAGWLQSGPFRALAAVFLLLLGGGFWWRNATTLDRWQRHAIGVLQKIEEGKVSFDHTSPDPTQLLAWLKEHGKKELAQHPKTLDGKTTYGCKTWDYQGNPISLMCFDWDGQHTVHLFTSPAKGLPRVPGAQAPLQGVVGGFETLVWTSGENVHMIASDLDRSTLRGVIARMEHRARARFLALIAELPH